MNLDALIAFTQANRNMKSYFNIVILNIIKTNKRIRILKTHLLFKLLRRVSSLSNCMLFASPSKFCLRRFFIFLTSEAHFSALELSLFFKSEVRVRTRTWLICYLVRTSMNFAHFAGFQALSFVDRTVPKKIFMNV